MHCSIAMGVHVYEFRPTEVAERDIPVWGDVLENEKFLPVQEGKKFKKSDLFIPGENIKCGDGFLMHTLDGRSLDWVLLNKNGEEVLIVSVYLFDSEFDARSGLVSQFCEYCDLRIGERWGKEETSPSGTWYVCRMAQGKKGNLLFASRGNFGISFIIRSSDDKITLQMVECLFEVFLDKAKHIKAGEELNIALQKRQDRKNERKKYREEEYRKEKEARELEKWKKDPCYQMPQLCDEVMAYDSSRAPVGLLKHGEVLNGGLMIPNTHEGRITLDMVKKWGGRSFRVEGVGHLRNGMHAVLTPSGSLAKTMEQGACVEILVAHARSRKEAMELLLKLRFYDSRNTQRDPKDVAASTVIKPGKVGDFDLGCGSALGPDGALVKGSEQSAVYFLRGNTAVMVLSSDPGYPVLGMARKLDAALQGKGIK